MGPVERELRMASEWMVKNYLVHGVWWPTLAGFGLTIGANRLLPQGASLSVDDWSEAIEAAEALGL
jgi:hypothetical protein